ncbi:MAG: nuclear transport factor 2 family protein [Nostoc sp.]|uniref:nuclear transport factor 2 family protein n=1 Tax=Nostoc sp. TaxID=1180 RepID=UPI002FFC1A67
MFKISYPLKVKIIARPAQREVLTTISFCTLMNGNSLIPKTIVALIVFLILISGSAVMVESKDEIEARNKAIVQASFVAWTAGTGSPFDLLADDVTWTIVGNSVVSKTYPTRDAFMHEVIQPFNARMRIGLKPTIRNIYADGNTVIIFFDASGTARDGKPYVNTYAWFFDMRDKKVVKASAFFDSVEFNEFWQRVFPKTPGNSE